MSLRHWLHLSLTEGLGPILQRRLLDAAGDIQSACSAPTSLLRSIEGIGPAKSSKIFSALKHADEQVDRTLDRCHELGLDIICPDDATWPVLLRSISDPPAVLYLKGSLEPRDLHSLAIVGARKCSHYGREQAHRFAAILSASGMTVISGGARGVDSAAHQGALADPDGRTLAVLGSGLDIAYPPENKPLFEQIADGRGAVISEYAPGTPPMAENFPRRNRIVSGLSRGVLVVEADIRSGALITARLAIEDQGRPVFALPGRVDNAMSAGPHKLIREGATLVTQLTDILDDLPPLPDGVDDPLPRPEQSLFEEKPETPIAPMPHALSDRQHHILGQLEKDAITIDTLIDRTDLPASVILQELTMLSLKGLVHRIDGQTYAKRS